MHLFSRFKTPLLSTLLIAAAAVGVNSSASASPSSTGTFQVLNGGFRNTSDNTATGYAEPLGGATFQRATSNTFASPFGMGPTDSAGLASASVSTGTWYARQKAAPSGWEALSQLNWNSSTRNYVGSASVTSGNTSTANITSSNGDSTRFVQRLVNPSLPTGCGNGLKVLLLLDTSGSTDGYGNDYKNASNAFINTLSGTPTNLKVSTFATESHPDNTTQYDLNTAAGQANAHTRISNIYPSNNSGSGYTNWDQALQDAGGAGVDVVVVVTDGDPTVHQGGGTNGNTGIADITYAIASANHAKNPGHVAGGPGSQTIMAVGVGSSLATNNLQAISGPNKGTDWTDAADPSELANTLKAIANKICGGTLTVNKSLVPADDPGKFDLLVNGTVKASNVGDGGTTGKLNVDAGKYTLTEQTNSSSPTSLSDYEQKLACQDKDGTVAVVDGVVEVKGNQDVNCAWTNTRKGGTLTLKKALSPADDPGLFDLKIDDVVKASAVGDGGTTGKQNVSSGKHAISETTNASSPNPLSDYNAALDCQDSSGEVPVTDGKVQVDSGKDVVCIFTNTRKTGKLTVNKKLEPSTDPGLFDLKINGTTKASAVGDGGTTGAQTLPTGKYTLIEDAAVSSPVALDQYKQTLGCQDDQGPVAVGAGGKVEVGNNQNITCVWTNTRKSGKITVVKSLNPATDPGLFDLKIDGTTKAAGVGDGGTTGAQYAVQGDHTVSEEANSSSPTSLSDYNTKLECKVGDILIKVVDGKFSLENGQNVVCVFTNTRKTGTLTLDKTLSPANDPGLFDLKIDGAVKASGVGDGGTTGAQTVTAGEHTLAEAANASSPTSLSDYNSSLTCQDDQGPVKVVNDKVQVDENQKVTCTWTNTRKAGTLQVKKALDPSADPGLFDLSIDGTVKASGVGDGGTTGKQYAVQAKHNVSETANSSSPTTLADYNTQLDCQDSEGSVSSKDGNVEVQDGQAVVCTFTNTRKAGTITLNKSLSPSNDPGLFDLLINGTVKAAGVGDGGTTGKQYAVQGEYTLGETANASSPNPLSSYNAELACQDGQGKVEVVDKKVQVQDGQDITCTWTNTRKTGTLTLNKTLSPSADPGLFDLQINGTTKATGVGDGGTTGAQTVNTGQQTLGETANASSPNPLSNYRAELACRDDQGSVKVVDNKVQVDENQKVTCTWTNTRKTGTLTLSKNLSPAADPGLFDLSINSTVKASGVGDGGTTGKQTVNTGEQSLSEAANASSPTSLSDYNIALACKDGQGDVKVTDNKVQVQDGQDVSCTYTNTRKAGKVTINKNLSPAADPGLFDLKLDGTIKASGVGDGGTTGAQYAVQGEHTVSEAANSTSPTALNDYSSELDCKDGETTVASTDGKIQVQDGQQITCTFTNTRKAGTIEVKKSLAPASDPGLFDLKIDGATKASGVGDGGTTNAQYAVQGAHTVTEDTNSSSPTTLADYNAQLACQDKEGTVPSVDGKVQIQDGQAVVCTFTNTRKQTIQFPLQAAVVGSGTVTSSVGGINCPGVSCNQKYNNGTVVNLTPQPAAGWVFQGWTGDCSGSAVPCIVTMNQARSVTAIFAQIAPTQSFVLRVQIHGHGKGRVKTSPAGINCIGICVKTYSGGQLVRLKQRPKSGYYFVRWGGACKGRGGCRVRMNQFRSVHAYYRKNPTRPRFTG